MLPAITNHFQQLAASYQKTFTDSLTDGYRFEVKRSKNVLGIRSLCYYKSENTLIVSHLWSNRIHLLNLTTGKLRWYDHHGTTVRSVLVRNHEIISASWDGTVCVTDFETLEKRLVCTDPEMGRCPDMAISSDLRYLYSYSYDSDRNPKRVSNSIRKWSLTNGDRLKLIEMSGKHLTSRRCGSCVVNEDLLFVVSDSGHLHIYDCQTLKLRNEVNLNDQLQSVCLLPAYDMVALGGDKGHIYLYDYSGGKINQLNNAHLYDVAQLIEHSEKPDKLISASFDGYLKVWRLPDLKLIHSMNIGAIKLWSVITLNDLYITGGEGRDILIYDTSKGTEPILKGKLTILDTSYAFVSSDSKKFFATNLKMMQVRKQENKQLLFDQRAEYMIKSSSNFEYFSKLFRPQNDEFPVTPAIHGGYYQIM